MLSLQKVWRRCRATSTSFPGEFPGVVIPGVLDGSFEILMISFDDSLLPFAVSLDELVVAFFV